MLNHFVGKLDQFRHTAAGGTHNPDKEIEFRFFFLEIVAEFLVFRLSGHVFRMEGPVVYRALELDGLLEVFAKPLKGGYAQPDGLGLEALLLQRRNKTPAVILRKLLAVFVELLYPFIVGSQC